jgi:alkylation response protein AidB-like acyl-CoA dehydrogenase
MYSLHLTAEQLEFRDIVKEFVQAEVKPVALHPSRLEPFDKPLLNDLLDYVSRMGLRTLTLSEAAGGAGGDTLTACIVLEELAAGDVDLAMALGVTQGLARSLEESMSASTRARFLAEFVEDPKYHLALVASDASAQRGWSYHRADAADSGAEPTATRQSNGDWVLSGTVPFVLNAPIAQLFIVQARTEPRKTGRNGLTTLIVPRATAGLTIGDAVQAFAGEAPGGRPLSRWYHGIGGEVRLDKCRVSADDVLGNAHQSPIATKVHDIRSELQIAAVNLGVGRAAYEAAVDYAKIRVQGGRPIVEHQAIGAILADITIKLELARNQIWKAAWAADHPEAVTDRSIPELPLHMIARVYTAEAVNEVALGAAECFGAMGVMRDMPLQKYVHDSFVFLNGCGHDSATKLEIAEAVAGFERTAAA